MHCILHPLVACNSNTIVFSNISYTNSFDFSESFIPFILLRYPDSEDWFLKSVISVISVVLRETTLTISDSTGETVLMEYEKVRVVYLSTAEIPRYHD